MSTSESKDRRQLLKDALDAVERMQSRLELAERARHEPIAIVGMACRFPGGANSPEEYWEMLSAGVDAVTEVPADRWTPEAYRRLDPKAAETLPPQYGGFLREVDRFDAQFFGISPREATTMDPQQRLVLETCWEALERAGVPAEDLAGSQSGVFIGITTSDYSQVIRQADPTNLDVYFATGNAHNATAGRVSFGLGLRGPAVAVDTACSSSLVATHLACQSLRLGDSNLALAGGVNLILVPDPFVCFAKWGMMAPDGRCKAFDASANGFVRAEGCGILVLKRLSDAVAAHDPILAVIAGSAVNQDGASGGLTVPSGLAQQAVIRQALAAARVEPSEVSYVETHGTGTSLGDPIELEAIDAVLGPGRRADVPLVVGSVKTNIGHCESASGVAGLIKTVLCLQHREIPPHLHFKALNPKINLRHLRVRVPVEAIPWVPTGERRLAGVSSFGFSGTNAHVVLSEAPAPSEPPPAAATDRPVHVLALSAKSSPALSELAERYRRRIEEAPGVPLADLCYSSATTRTPHLHRAGVPVTSRQQAAEALSALAAGRTAPRVAAGSAAAGRLKIAFLYTGQGAQYAGMGRDLYETQAVFREALDRCRALMAPVLDRDLLGVLYPEPGLPSPIDETGFTQPALFALEYALTEMWRSWGVAPSAVLGHSVGEFAAAAAAGVMSLEDGARLIAARGRLMQALPAGGAMAALGCGVEQAQDALRPLGGRVTIAAMNAPDGVVVSGLEADVLAVTAALEAEGVRCQRLAVSHAFHSPLMEPILSAFEHEAARGAYAAPDLDFASNLHGRLLGPDEIVDAAYWRRHLREPVRFADGLRALREGGCRVFVEIGPGSTLLGLGRRNDADEALAWLPSLKKGRGDWEQVADSLARLYVEGAPIDWAAFDRPYGRRRVALPTYPFQRSRFWIAPPAGATALPRRTVAQGAAAFLESRITLAADPGGEVWEGELSLERYPFLADHVVQGRAVFPATGYAEMVLEAAGQLLGDSAFCLDRVEYQKPLFLSEGRASRVQLTLRPSPDGGMAFAIYSTPLPDARPAGPTSPSWTRHVQGRVRAVERSETVLGREELEALLARCSDEVDGTDFYRRLAERGNSWGRAFQGVERVWRGEGEAVALVKVPEEVIDQASLFHFHPAVSDASGHVLVATQPLERSDGPRGGAFVGGAIEETRLHRRPRGRSLWAHAFVRDDGRAGPNVLVGDLRLYDEDLVLVSELRGARLWYLGGGAAESAPVADWLYGVEFEPAPAAPIILSQDADGGAWLLLADGTGVAEALAGRLASAGHTCFRAEIGATFERRGERRFSLRAGSREDAEQLLAAIRATGEPLRGVVHLWSLDARAGVEVSVADIEEGLRIGVASAVPLVQALANGPDGAARLWLVTRGAQHAAPNDRVDAVAASALWGLGRALAVETPGVWGGLVDLDVASEPGEAARCVESELTAADANDQVAWRQGRRLVARLARKVPAGPGHAPSWRGDRTYLVSGGLGGLGLLFAGGLVDRGARHLVLLGRRGLPGRDEWDGLPAGSKASRQVAAIRAMEAKGARILAAAVDVADEAALARCLADVEAAGWPPVGGVLHAAGTIAHGPIGGVSAAEFLEVCRPKIVGGWLLHRLLAGAPVEHFISFSSASAVLSSPFVASYAAANAGLDALAHHRTGAGLPALSVDWGLWAGVGMADGLTDEQLQAVSTRGMGTVPAAAGLTAFEAAASVGEAQVAVMPVDWVRWRELYPSFLTAPLFEHVAAELAGVGGTRVSAPVATRIDLAALTAEERRVVVAGSIKREVEAVAGLEPDSLDVSVPLTAVGLDSLMASELRTRIERQLGAAPPLVALLEGQSVLELAAALARTVGGATTMSASHS
nr:type I polyketide synthase [Acidobacteriota bacterium]